MLYLPLALIAGILSQNVGAQIAGYAQCGGMYNGLPWTGSTVCCAGYFCEFFNSGWSGCSEAPAPAGTVARWGACGGIGYTGSTICQPGTTCNYQTPTWSRCEAIPCPVVATSSSTLVSAVTSSSKKSSSSLASSSSVVQPSSSSSSRTSSSSSASSSSIFKSSSSSSTKISTIISTSSSSVTQKSSLVSVISSVASTSIKLTSIPVVSSFKSSSITSSSKLSSTLTTLATSSKLSTTIKTSSSAPATTSLSCAVNNSPPANLGNVSLIDIVGCEFPGNVDAYNDPSGSQCPNGMVGRNDGGSQMAHFVTDDHFNTFRLPVSWQFLINSRTVSSTLNPTNWAAYDFMVQKCLITGAFCLVEVHNFAKFEGYYNLVGQSSGGPSNAVFAALWANIAAKYAGNPKIIFGLMNEPHDVNINLWAVTCQAAVTAIRGVETYQHMILLPGNNYASAGTFLSDGSAAALSTVTNPDGSFTNLVFDVHKYLDANNAGDTNECPYDYISSAFAPLAQWLRCNRRKAFLTEIGGGNTDSCHTNLCKVVAFLNANSDVYVGYLGWGAGQFDTSHTMTETPWGGPGTWSDQWIVTVCLQPIH